MTTFFQNVLSRLNRFILGNLPERVEVNLLLSAQLHVRRISQLQNIDSLHDVEFKAYSQWGEDGIIQYLINAIPIPNEIFIEFGVEDYTEANTRFLLKNDNWKGLVIDGSKEHIARIRTDNIYWKHDLTAECQFITRNNINDIILNAGFKGDIGLLSIDIDGNDYWVWEAIETINPRIVICEYNSVFGAEQAVSIPYDAKFQRTTAHYSNLYFGASLPALCLLADKKGYDFVGSNSVGSNAFFIRQDLSHGLKKMTAKEGYIKSKVRESRDQDGRLTFLTGSQRMAAIEHLKVIEVSSGNRIMLKNIGTKKLDE